MWHISRLRSEEMKHKSECVSIIIWVQNEHIVRSKFNLPYLYGNYVQVYRYVGTYSNYIQVQLDIILRNENVVNEMMYIMEELQEKYVPMHIIDTSELNCECLHKIVIGGDQLTVTRCRAAQIGRRNEVHPTKHLRGLLPVVEDWHAKQCFLEVCHFFKWNMHTHP